MRVKTVPTGRLRDQLGRTKVWGRGCLDRLRKWTNQPPDESRVSTSTPSPQCAFVLLDWRSDSYRSASTQTIDAMSYEYL